MKITHSEFANSCYYIGAGKDIEPLLRFSHLCDTFLCANLYMDCAEILDYLHRSLDGHPLLELIDEEVDHSFEERTHFELHRDYRRHLAGASFLNEGELEDYARAFVPAHEQPQWMITLHLRRRDTGRLIKLIYFTAEGLAAYILLSHNGLHVPRLLVTVETKKLECRNSLILDLFRQMGSRPPLWVKGYQGHRMGPRERYRYDCVGFRFFQPDAVYRTVAMDLAFHWEAEGEYIFWGNPDPTAKSERLCKVFATDEGAAAVLGRPFRDFGRHRIERGDVFDVAAREGKEGDWLVVTSRMLPPNSAALSKLRLVTWESLMAGRPSRLAGKTCMDESLQSLQMALDQAAQAGMLPDHVFFVPLGLEDQGQILARFLEDFKLTPLYAAVRRAFDLSDLRCSVIPPTLSTSRKHVRAPDGAMHRAHIHSPSTQRAFHES